MVSPKRYIGNIAQKRKIELLEEQNEKLLKEMAALQKRGKKRRTAMETINRISFLLYSTIIVCYASLWVAKIQLMRLIYNKSLFF